MLCIGLLYFYYRLFAVHLPISPTLGPLLYRLKLMVTIDFVNFMRMAALVICSSGVVIQAITFPDTWPLDIRVFRHALHKAVITLFTTPVEELKGESRDSDQWSAAVDKIDLLKLLKYKNGNRMIRLDQISCKRVASGP